MNTQAQDSGNSHAAYYIPMDRIPPRFTVLGHWRNLLAAIQAIHALVASRLPLCDGLLHLSQDAPNRVLWFIFYWLHRELKGGVPLHVAMGNRPEFFPAFCVDLVQAGEDSGQLEEALADLEQEIADGLDFRRGLLWHLWFLGTALLGPAIMTTGVMLFVAPQLESVFGAFGQPPSPLMQWAGHLHYSGALFFLMLAALGLPVLWFIAEFSFARGGYTARLIASATAWLPLVGGAMRKRHLAGAASMLGRLLKAGAPLPAALRTTALATSAALCARSLNRLAGAVEAGETLKDAMKKERWVLPRSFRTLVATGEKSGQLPEALMQLASHYRNQTQTAKRLAVEIGIPLTVCLNGAIVFIVYGGLFTSIFNLIGLVE